MRDNKDKKQISIQDMSLIKNLNISNGAYNPLYSSKRNILDFLSQTTVAVPILRGHFAY